MTLTSSTTSIKSSTVLNQFNIHLISGLITGVLVAGLFNFWDRALYLSVSNQRNFLLKANFQAPFQGILQAIIQRTLLGGLYFTLQGEASTYLEAPLRHQLHMNETLFRCVVGLVAGSMSGGLTNGISVIKYHQWGHDERSFYSSLQEIWTKGGAKTFFHGINATMTRDVVFGSTYETLRTSLRKQNAHFEANPLLCNILAGSLATLVSGPFNYVKNIQYSIAPGEKNPPMISLLNQFCVQLFEQKTHLERLSFFQQKLRIGWGTARVGVGMGVGQWIFDHIKSTLEDDSTHYPPTKG